MAGPDENWRRGFSARINRMFPHAGPASAIEAEAQRLKTVLLYRNAGIAQSVNIVNGTLLAYVNFTLHTPAGLAAVWWFLIVAIAVGRYFLARRFFASDPDAAASMAWRQRYLLATALAAAAWAAGTVIFMWNAPDGARLFTGLVLSGMVAGAVPILAPVKVVFRIFALLLILPMSVAILLQANTPLHWAFGFMTLVYLAAMLASAQYLHETLDVSIRLGLEKQSLVENLDRARRDAEAANIAKSQFLATMSHEIRTPMNGIFGMAQLLLIPGLTDEERRDYARTILNSGQTLLTLLNDILDFSKVEAGKLELTLAACDPRQVVEETTALLANLAQAKSLKIEAAWRGPVGQQYWTDPIRLRQMLSNLVSNAVKFTTHGFVRVEATEIERREGDALLEFSVTDSGIGVPPDKQSLLFKPFSQADSSTTRDYGGTGLGLSIVRSLAKLMGGDVGVESQPGKGSRFWFRIRAEVLRAGQECRQVGRGAASVRVSAAPAGLAGLILLAEDNPTNRKVAEALLRKLGLRVESVDTGQAVVDAATRGRRPDLLLMDVQMPVLDGFQATERIRAWEAAAGQARLPIVALTAGALEDDRQACSACGMDDFLPRPISMQDLSAMLAKWLDGKTAS